MNNGTIVFCVLAILTPIIMIIVGFSLLGKLDFYKHRTRKTCTESQEHMINNSLKKGEACPVWDKNVCLDGVYDGKRCNLKKKENVGRLLVLYGLFLILPLALITVLIIYFKSQDTWKLFNTPVSDTPVLQGFRFH
jgi:hypothetical protein